jgi:hypothetical protein
LLLAVLLAFYSPTIKLNQKEELSLLSMLKWFNLALRVLMEVGIIVALGYWGFQTAKIISVKILLGIGAPVVGFGFWGLVDFHQAGKAAEPLRLSQELVISGLAAVALYSVGQHTLGWTLGLVSIVYHALVYLLGGKSLERIRGGIK